MTSDDYVFIGILAFSNSLQDLEISSSFIVVEDGKITKKGSKDEYEKLKKTGAFLKHTIIVLNSSQFLIPGFVDCHTHAPQFPNIGLGLDRPLLEWLEKYTFPLEKRYSDVEFASKVYSIVVQRLLNNGTTTACYFGSLHLEGTTELVKSAIKKNQRAMIGKVSMNVKNDAGYYNNTEKELKDVQSFIEKVLEYKNDLVQPVITPRFAISCDDELMTGLAKLSNTYGCRIQSHISENPEEIKFVLQSNPSCTSYAQVYDKCEILNNRCIMAHAIHLTDDEINTFVQKGVSIAHCPASNTRLKSGLCPVKKYLDHGIDVGLGTDVSGGDSSSLLDAMRRALDVSTHLQLVGSGSSLDWKEVFYLATMGGAKALNLDDVIGNFEVGKDFDALLIDVFAEGSQIDDFETMSNKNMKEHAEGLLHKFIYVGDDRNILQVYVKGQKVKDIS